MPIAIRTTDGPTVVVTGSPGTVTLDIDLDATVHLSPTEAATLVRSLYRAIWAAWTLADAVRAVDAAADCSRDQMVVDLREYEPLSIGGAVALPVAAGVVRRVG